MTLRVSGKNMDVGESLRTRAEGHFDTVVKKYFDGGYTGHLTLEPEGSGFNAACMVHLDSGTVLQATSQSYILASPDDGSDELADDYSPPVIAETTKNLRQMSVEEAVMELDLTQADIVMFRHAGHGGLNVVYRRADGNIGWIDPALRAN